MILGFLIDWRERGGNKVYPEVTTVGWFCGQCFLFFLKALLFAVLLLYELRCEKTGLRGF